MLDRYLPNVAFQHWHVLYIILVFFHFLQVQSSKVSFVIIPFDTTHPN